ncbi:hypothetical protein Q7P35_009802 [Cladosporium inversicolor]
MMSRPLEVRRRGLHEPETERLGLTELCRYDTRVVTEDEEIGPEGIETNERQPADGDGSNPIPIDDEPIIEPLHQTEVDPLENLEPPRPHGQPSVADEIAPIVELLRKRRREEREESDIRREEQVLLNKRLAMMEEQVKMLSKLITQNNFPPATPCPQEDVDMNNSAEVTAEPGVEVETAATSESVHDIIVIDDAPAEDALEERADAPFDPVTSAKPTGRGFNKRSNTSLEPSASTGPEHLDVGEHVPGEATSIPADVSMDESAELPDKPFAELETTTSIGTTETRDGAAQVTDDAADVSPTANSHEVIDYMAGAIHEDQFMDIPGTTDATH